jgi:hypothetical protein
MKKTIFTIIICASIATSTLAGPHGVAQYGGNANYTRLGGHYAGRGGEFTLYGEDLLLSNSAYASTTSGLGGISRPNSLQTFCLETDENTLNDVDVYISLSSADGLGSGSHAFKGGSNTDSGDDLDAKTAYLYHQFAKGTLSGYDFGSGGYNGLNRSQTAGALQRLIWATEDEGGADFTNTFYSISLNADQQELIDLWNAEFDNSGWTGIGDVRVLQIVYEIGPGTWHRQDFIYVTPVPGAVLLGVIGLAVAGVKLRKFA